MRPATMIWSFNVLLLGSIGGVAVALDRPLFAWLYLSGALVSGRIAWFLADELEET